MATPGQIDRLHVVAELSPSVLGGKVALAANPLAPESATTLTAVLWVFAACIEQLQSEKINRATDNKNNSL